MNKGIEILMARMESNPDEFMGVNNKWVNLMDSYEDHMVEEDRKALYAKYSALHMDKFTEHVMKKLLAEQEEKSEAFGNYAQSLGASMVNTKNQIAQQLLNRQNAAQQAQGGMLGLQAGIAQSQAQMSNIAALNAYSNASGTLVGATVPSYAIQDSNQASNSCITQGTIQLGKQTLTEKTIKRLKALLK